VVAAFLRPTSTHATTRPRRISLETSLQPAKELSLAKYRSLGGMLKVLSPPPEFQQWHAMMPPGDDKVPFSKELASLHESKDLMAKIYSNQISAIRTVADVQQKKAQLNQHLVEVNAQYTEAVTARLQTEKHLMATLEMTRNQEFTLHWQCQLIKLQQIKILEGEKFREMCVLNTLKPIFAHFVTQSLEELEADCGSKRYASAVSGAHDHLRPLYDKMTLSELSLAKPNDWRAANLCHLGDKLFQAGMQAPPDELLKYGPVKVGIFFANDPGRGKSVIQYMEALLKQHGADAGVLKDALLELDMQTLKLFATSHILRIRLQNGSWNNNLTEANRQVLAQVLAQVVAAYSSDGTWQECAAAAVAKCSCLVVNATGKSVFATEEENTTLRHALDNANGILGDVKWADLAVALAQVTKYERNWNRGHDTVTRMAREIKKQKQGLQTKKRKRGG
jgi:hypothetical protein